jgi:uncharacterized protein RhaS with RHS repeats
LYFLGARYYDPETGRFLSPNPLGFAASNNLYDYAGGDPVNACDPDGRLETQTAPRWNFDRAMDVDMYTPEQAKAKYAGYLSQSAEASGLCVDSPAVKIAQANFNIEVDYRGNSAQRASQRVMDYYNSPGDENGRNRGRLVESAGGSQPTKYGLEGAWALRFGGE